MSDITLGIIGSGQLGSLLCQAAKKLNVKTVVISDDKQGRGTWLQQMEQMEFWDIDLFDDAGMYFQGRYA